MSNNNTIAGWVLAGGIAALGFSIVSGKYFHAGKHERPEVMGYVIEGVETAGGGADAGPSIEALLQTADVAAGEKILANAPPATRSIRAAPMASVRTCGPPWASRMAMSRASPIATR